MLRKCSKGTHRTLTEPTPLVENATVASVRDKIHQTMRGMVLLKLPQ